MWQLAVNELIFSGRVELNLTEEGRIMKEVGTELK
jgi:hypothetical protein